MAIPNQFAQHVVTVNIYMNVNDPIVKRIFATDGLAALPKDYIGLPSNVPQLGPSLPGDLGRPILNAHSAGKC